MADAPTKDGLPRRSFAYTPTAKPDDWKLPYLTADGAPDPDHLPGAVAAISEGGFRGQQADIPSDAMPTIKAKLRQAYKRWGKKGDDIPASIREVEDLRSATIRESADMSFDEIRMAVQGAIDAANPAKASSGPTSYSPGCWIRQIYDGYVIWEGPDADGDPGERATFKQSYAIDANDGEATLLGDPVEVMQNTEWVAVTESAAEDVVLEEKGARNSKADLAKLQAAHDALHDAADVPKHDFSPGDKAAMKEAGGTTDLAATSATKVLAVAHVHNPLTDGKKKLRHSHENPTASHAGYGPAVMTSPATTPLTESSTPFEVIIDRAAAATPVRFAESGMASLVTLQEAGAVFDDATRTVKITPIRPGAGNKRDGLYYPASTLREAVDGGLFDNRKMFANHPSKSQDKERPERDVRDWVAVVKETTWDEDRNAPRSTVKVLDQAVYDRWRDAPEHIAFSVLGNGTARPGRVDGTETRIVESVKNIRSIDWVTEAGAGGAIDFAESDYEEQDMKIEEMTLEQIKAARPELFREADDGESKTPPADDAASQKANAANAHPDAPGGQAGEGASGATATVGTDGGTATAKTTPAAGEGTPDGFVSRQEFDNLRRELAEQKIKEAAADGKVKAHQIVAATIKEAAGLPRAAREYVDVRFAEASVGEGLLFADEAGLKAAVEAEIAAMQKVTDAVVGRSRVSGLGASSDDKAPTTLRESKEQQLIDRMGRETMPKPISDEPGTPAGSTQLSESGQTAQSRLASRI